MKVALVFTSMVLLACVAQGDDDVLVEDLESALEADLVIEAETMTLSTYYKDPGLNETAIRLPSASSTGTATKSFPGSTGTYAVDIVVIIEDDGTPKLSLSVGSTLVKSFVYPLRTSGMASRYTLTVSGVSIAQGQTIKLTGTGDRGAYARVDTIGFRAESAPPPPPPTTETARGCPSSGYLRLVSVSTNSQLVSALANAQAGDQIRLAAGTYSGEHDLSRSGTATAPIVVCGLPGTNPLLAGGRFKVTGSHILVTGMVMQGGKAGVGGSCPSTAEYNVMWIAGGTNVSVIGNEVRFSAWHAGVSVDGRDHTIKYNYFHDNGCTSIDHHVYNRASGTKIIGNVMLRAGGRGVSIHDNGGARLDNVTVVHNTIVLNDNTGILVSSNGGTGHVVANNIFAQNGNATGNKQVRVHSGCVMVKNNLTHSTGSNSGIENTSTCSTLAGNVIADPRFVANFGDLHLQIGSPAIGLGLPLYAVSPDFDGKARDSAPDAGAYER